MKKLFVLLIASSLLFFCKVPETGNFKILTPAVYAERVSQDNEIIVDVRTRAEFESGHIANAQNINVLGDDFKAKISKLDKEKPVYIYCRSGSRSGKAGKILQEMGFKEIYDLEGGINSWNGALKK